MRTKGANNYWHNERWQGQEKRKSYHSWNQSFGIGFWAPHFEDCFSKWSAAILAPDIDNLCIIRIMVSDQPDITIRVTSDGNLSPSWFIVQIHETRIKNSYPAMYDNYIKGIDRSTLTHLHIQIRYISFAYQYDSIKIILKHRIGAFILR